MKDSNETHEVLHQLEANGVDLPESIRTDLVRRQELTEELRVIEGRLEAWVGEVAAITKRGRGKPYGYTRVVVVPDGVAKNPPPNSADTGEAVLAAMAGLGAECTPLGIANVLRLWGRTAEPGGVRGWLDKFKAAGAVRRKRFGVYALTGNGDTTAAAVAEDVGTVPAARFASTEEAVVAAMQAIGRVCGPTEISEVLASWGRSRSTATVGNNLLALQGQGRVERVRYGSYRLADGDGAGGG